MRLTFTRKFLIGTLCTLALACAVKADSLTILNLGNSAISGYTGPYATLTIDLSADGHTADFTFSSLTYTPLTGTQYEYLIGGAQAAAVNVDSTSFHVVGGITTQVPNSTFTPQPSGSPTYTIDTVNGTNSDGWGKFNLSIDMFDGYTQSTDQLSFSIYNDAGTWGDATQVLTQNAVNGYVAAAHIFVSKLPLDATISSNNPATGYAATQGGYSTLPEPAPSPSALLGGVALLGLVAFRRKLGFIP